MIERISIEHDICEADGMNVWFIYANGALFRFAHSKTEVLEAIAEILRKDLGKVKALREAGWPVTKIADEFGVAEQTVRNWMKEAEA